MLIVSIEDGLAERLGSWKHLTNTLGRACAGGRRCVRDESGDSGGIADGVGNALW